MASSTTHKQAHIDYSYVHTFIYALSSHLLIPIRNLTIIKTLSKMSTPAGTWLIIYIRFLVISTGNYWTFVFFRVCRLQMSVHKKLCKNGKLLNSWCNLLSNISRSITGTSLLGYAFANYYFFLMAVAYVKPKLNINLHINNDVITTRCAVSSHL